MHVQSASEKHRPDPLKSKGLVFSQLGETFDCTYVHDLPSTTESLFIQVVLEYSQLLTFKLRTSIKYTEERNIANKRKNGISNPVQFI